MKSYPVSGAAALQRDPNRTKMSAGLHRQQEAVTLRPVPNAEMNFVARLSLADDLVRQQRLRGLALHTAATEKTQIQVLTEF